MFHLLIILLGISASTGLPFSPPIAFRSMERANAGKKERKVVQQGKCHKCESWVAVEGIKDMESKVRFFLLLQLISHAAIGR